ncbi:MAG: T9SS type A sorting domain-containing protein, partial [Candidatus Delongbacteria bacterium]
SMDGGADGAWVDNILATNILVGIEEDIAKIPSDPVLYQNYPNPFNPATTIKFSLPEYQKVRLNIYNSAGQLVRNVLDRSLNKGVYSVNIDVSGLHSGIYIYSLETSFGSISKKMLYLK